MYKISLHSKCGIYVQIEELGVFIAHMDGTCITFWVCLVYDFDVYNLTMMITRPVRRRIHAVPGEDELMNNLVCSQILLRIIT